MCVVHLSVSESFAGKGVGSAIMDQHDASAILTRVILHYNWPCTVIVHAGCVQQFGLYPGFEVLQGCMGQGIPIPSGKLRTEEDDFIGKAEDEEPEVGNQA